jgi:hypothetical protein
VVPLPGFAVHLQRALMSAHNAQHGRQAQTSTGEFGGKKRLEDAPLNFRVHAATGIRFPATRKIPSASRFVQDKARTGIRANIP